MLTQVYYILLGFLSTVHCSHSRKLVRRNPNSGLPRDPVKLVGSPFSRQVASHKLGGKEFFGDKEQFLERGGSCLRYYAHRKVNWY